MARKPLILAALLCISALLLSGCYTVILAPTTAREGSTADGDAARRADVKDEDSAARDWDDDYYRYPGAPGHSYSSHTYPQVIYDSRYGLYGYGGYGSGYPYYYDYRSAYGYGYDPYYSGYGGYSGSYVPPGYRLVDENELQQLEETIRQLSRQNSEPPPPATEPSLVQKREEEAWDRRSEPRVRSAPAVAPRPAPSSSSSSGKAVRSAPKSSSSKSSSSKSSSRPKKRGR